MKFLLSAFLFVFTFCFGLIAQHTSLITIEEIIKQTESAYGVDDNLVNGAFFIPFNPNADGNPYFISNNWFEARIQTNGETFPVDALKYDICQEKLILLVQLRSGSRKPIIIPNPFVERFEFENKTFVPQQQFFPELQSDGFVHLVYEGKLVWIIKYRKEFVNMLTKVTPYGKFSETIIQHFVVNDGKTIRIRSKRDLLNAFPIQRKDIGKFMKNNNIRLRKANLVQLKLLANFCDESKQTK